MIRIQASAFKEPAKQLLIKANTEIRPDVKKALREALKIEKGDAKKAVEALLENQKIAGNNEIPLCQDTGYISFYLNKGPNVCIEGDIYKVLNDAAAEAYDEHPFRLSMVNDPIERTPLKTNTPVFLYRGQITENKAILKVIVKGAGSDNGSALEMFLGSTPKEEISSWIIAKVAQNGPKACPPLVVGVGIGGGFERSALLSKKAFFRKIGERNRNKLYSAWEKELLLRINKLGVGPSAFGGKTTALDVFIEQSPVHMACMPVSVNICCYALRTAAMEVGV